MVRAMSAPIKRVAVLGAGVMGSGIAAHVANAGYPVLLLDIVPPDLDESVTDPARRNAFAAGAVKKMLAIKPGGALFHASRAQLISVGNLTDDLDDAARADLVIEAVIERLDIKQKLFARLEKLVDGDTIVASNTSGLRIADMLEGRTDDFKKRFCVTHFFNPPRYMKLLELVAGSDTDPRQLLRAAEFGREALGKGIVFAKDSPNFIANRIGAHSMMSAIHLMLEKGLAPEDIDQITGLPMGHPKTATFQTGDLVGLDTLVNVVDNCHKVLTDDEDREVFTVPDYIRQMIESKQLGRKTQAGFYKKSRAGIETLDPKTGEYRAKGGSGEIRETCKSLAKVDDIGKRVRELVATEGTVGEVAWQLLSKSLAYTARRVGEISDDIAAIDDAMRWGYNWELGPFETWDALGFAETYDRMVADGHELPESFQKMRADGIESFYGDADKVYDPLKADHLAVGGDPREIKLEVMRQGDSAVLANNGAEAWDLGDGVLGVTFKTKANSIDPDVIQMLHQAVDRAERDFRALLIFNQGSHFGLGANLGLVMMAAGQKNWEQIRDMVAGFQEAVMKLRYSSIPVVAAPYQMTVGGGMELCLAANGVQAAAETYAGQVEVGVGLIPGGAGNVNLLWRALEAIPDGAEIDPYAIVTQVFKNIAMANMAFSAGAAIEMGYFPRDTGISFDRARHLHEAKQRAVGMAESGFHPPARRAFRLPGASGIATLSMMVNTLVAGGYASEHDALIANKLAHVLCGGEGGAAREVTEDEMLELEREAFVSLCGEKKSIERMGHMLMKNKPLRN
jgi:3-hydroxyacyl-CoA dehydrogenase